METYGKLLIKIDLLSVEALDKMHLCLDLLSEQGYIDKQSNLRETYNKYLNLYVLDRTSDEEWDMVKDHKILSLFQMEKTSGLNGIAATNPRSVDELAVLNSVIRLMASEPGAEQPLDMWTRYRNDINEWLNEMRNYGLTEDQIKWLANHEAIVDGICEAQEGLMQLLQEERLGGNDLSFADKCRKAIAKKQGKLFEECEEFYFKNAEEKGCEMNLVSYVWNVLLKVQRGYSFCRAHTLAYSLIALQEMNLAYHYPIIFWNCACLINDAGGEDNSDIDETSEDLESDEIYYDDIEDFDDDEDENDEDDEDSSQVVAENGKKKKKKTTSTNFGKIATAIGKMQNSGIEITTPNINSSTFTFSPDVENNVIRYGFNGMSRIKSELIKEIIANRPYASIDDFLNKVKIRNKLQMINLIKGGAFDCFNEDRVEVMKDYITKISDQKSTLNMRNALMLIKNGLIPKDTYEHEIKVFWFNKYLKQFKYKECYELDKKAEQFYTAQGYDYDLIITKDNKLLLGQKPWDKIYKKEIEPIKQFIKDNLNELLETVNNKSFMENWNKYASGNISKWEMDSLSFYSHSHELANVNKLVYDLSDFGNLPKEPIVERTFPSRQKNGTITKVPLYKINRIAGTVLDRDKGKGLITLLTTTGVVTVRIYKQQFAKYDKRISVKQANGKKKVMEESWFKRGNKLILTGFRREDEFVLKKYKHTPYSVLELIKEVHEDGTLEKVNKRYDELWEE